jgi:hypothetical protein
MKPEVLNAKNEMIAKFLGYTLEPCNNGLAWDHHNKPEIINLPFSFHGELRRINLKFDISWDWLMPVVRKIVELCIDNASVETEDDLFMSDYYTSILDTVPLAVIEDAFRVVAEFIEWYNSIDK